MIEVRRILCPTDFSEFSREALAHALALARWYGAEIEALHVVPQLLPQSAGPLTYPGWTVLSAAQRVEIQADLERFVVPAHEAGIGAQARLQLGDPAREIVAEAGRLPADLVVMGSHGRGGFEHWVLGSVTEKVIQQAPSPVLVVTPPAEAPRRPADVVYKRILCAVDFSEASTEALGYALSLAQEAAARLTLLHVVEWLPEGDPRPQPGPDVPELRRLLEEDARKRLYDAVPTSARDWCTPEEVVTGGRAWREILRVARERDVQLVVMGVHGRGALARTVFGSTSHKVVRSAACPVLTIRVGAAHAGQRVEETAGASRA